MYLTRLDLFGFKSFAKKTEIHFHDGITAIVGPNGCGKSNIVDAIRWVLGEQKAGILRSDSMQNVIFNGTKTHKPLGMAEVSLTIQNNRNVLPIEYSEVVITRRLFRSGESQYLLNNSVCRLKDILDLFMDTGVGPNAYSVIELNMVEKILNGRPEERRQIFEEAAGVTKYKIRRKAAYRKLEATEQDLIRLSDILSEVEKSVNSLRRQVLKAQRYKNYSDELKQLELDYSAYHLARIREELGPLTEEFKEIRKQREEVASQLAGEEAEIERKQFEILEIERQLNARRNDLNANSQRIQAKEEEILVSQERVKAAQQARERASREIEDLRVRAATLADEKEELYQRVADAEVNLKEVEKKLAAAREVLQRFQDEYSRKRQQGQHLEQERLKKLEELGELRKRQERLTTQVEYSNNQLKALRDEAADLAQNQREIDASIKELEEQRSALSESIEGMMNKLEGLHQTIADLRETLDSGKQHVLELQGQIQSRRERAKMLRQFIETYEDYPEGVKHLLQEKAVDPEKHGVVGEILQVENRYRKAIEVALGEAAVALVVEHTDQALEAIRKLKETGKGAVMFLPLQHIETKKPHSRENNGVLAQIDGFIGAAMDLVQVPESHEKLLAALLEHVYVAADLPAALEIARRLSPDRAAVVTLEGEIAYSWGAIRGGESENTEASLVGRRAIIEALEQEIQTLTQELERLQASLAEKEQQLQQLLAQEKELADKKSQQSELLQKAEVAYGQALVEKRRTAERLETIEREIDVLEKESGVLAEAQEELQPQFEVLEKEKQQIEEKYTRYQADLESIEKELKQAEEKVQEIHLEYATRQAELKNDQLALERLLKSEKEIEATIQRRKEEIRTASETIDELNARIAELREELQDDFAERKELEEVIAEIEKEYSARREEIETRDKSLRKVRARRDEMSEKVHEMELRISQLQMNEKNLVDHIREAYEVDLSAHPVPESLDVDQTSQRINELKQKLRAIGPVNMLALKDYEREKERLDFLLAQKQDLLDAEANLKETIRVINKTAYERFNQVFSKVRENFIQVFQSFFENGSADLRLEGDDPLEAEIVIEANPKGRKLGALALLSGGEKALTAISLLFALYLVKPSPFCILDEVDAPLDDANIRRFTSALKKFSDKTQFIVVTHNKLTMGAANQLYGITMEEPGISKVVSVKFEGQEDIAESEARKANV